MIIRRDRGMLGVLIMLDVAFHASRAQTVSAADIAERSGLARRGIEPVLQALSRSGLLASVRGPRGGYRLGRPRREISLREIVAAATQGEAAHGAEDSPAGRMQLLVIDPLWGQLEEVLARRMAEITLDELVRRAEAVGMLRPSSEPISFSI